MSNKKLSISKVIVSMTEISQMCQMSRSRFYQLLEIGFFPKPLYDNRSKRPYYNIELQQKIVECRHSGIGIDGSYMLFYSPRKKENTNSKKVVGNKPKLNSPNADIAETLNQMGVDVNCSQVGEAIQHLYPDGVDSLEQGLVVRELFRHFKK